MALAKFLKVPEDDMRSRFYAAKMWLACEGDAATVASAMPHVQEHAASYFVNKHK